MENRRSLYRFLPPFLKDQYFLREGNGPRGRCVVFNISRKGVGLKFHTAENINVGSIIRLEMFVSRESEPVNIKGILKWFKKWEGDFSGGIELTEVLDDATWAKLF